MIPQTETSWALQPHGMTFSRVSAEPTGLCTLRSKTTSLVKSSGHWDTHRQKPKGLQSPDQLGSQEYQEYKIYLTGSGAWQSRIIHTNATNGTTGKQATATTKQQKCSTPTISAHSNTKVNITLTSATNSSTSETHQRDALILCNSVINTRDQYCKLWWLSLMQQLFALPEALYHSVDVRSNVYNTLLICKEKGVLNDDLFVCTYHPSKIPTP